MHTKIKAIVELAVANKASDIHLDVMMRPMIRVDGELREVTNFELGNDGEMVQMVESLAGEGQVLERLKKDKEVDFSLTVEGIRLRANLFYRTEKLSAALRIIPGQIPRLGTLGLPSVLGSFIDNRQGFVLITGPTGQGKSTTVAAMLEEINQSRADHIVTVEDPIEYLLEPKKALVSQREIGQDTNSFASALRSCLRQDPNVVFVGEMRDLETVAAALTIAETGHLVFSTLHTNSATQTIDRIVDVFPEGMRQQVRVQLASVLTAVVSQRLVPMVDGGRVPAAEVMITTSAIRNMVREGKNFMIDNAIQTGGDNGMMSLEMSLAGLVKAGKISEETAMSFCLHPMEFQGLLRRI